MSSPNEPYVERRVIEEPAVVRRDVVEAPRAASNAGWWVAALVAIVAVAALLFMFNGGRTTDADLQAARDSGRTEVLMNT
ncbi:MAG: hypothetical protein Q8M88_04940, partial [Phenylobacterium sp.]|nr:hypothetical protein [Phenylobacterium sp.]